MDILEKLFFSKIEHFTLDWAQNFLVFGIHSTSFPEVFYGAKTLQISESVNSEYSEKSPIGSGLIQLTMYLICLFKSLTLI